MPEEELHIHRWFVQNEDEPAQVYLVCIQCGEVVDPPTFLAMREIVKVVARLDPMLENGYGWPECVFGCGAGELGAPSHTPECPYTKARKLLNE